MQSHSIYPISKNEDASKPLLIAKTFKIWRLNFCFSKWINYSSLVKTKRIEMEVVDTWFENTLARHTLQKWLKHVHVKDTETCSENHHKYESLIGKICTRQIFFMWSNFVDQKKTLKKRTLMASDLRKNRLCRDVLLAWAEHKRNKTNVVESAPVCLVC